MPYVCSLDEGLQLQFADAIYFPVLASIIGHLTSYILHPSLLFTSSASYGFGIWESIWQCTFFTGREQRGVWIVTGKDITTDESSEELENTVHELSEDSNKLFRLALP